MLWPRQQTFALTNLLWDLNLVWVANVRWALNFVWTLRLPELLLGFNPLGLLLGINLPLHDLTRRPVQSHATPDSNSDNHATRPTHGNSAMPPRLDRDSHQCNVRKSQQGTASKLGGGLELDYTPHAPEIPMRRLRTRHACPEPSRDAQTQCANSATAKMNSGSQCAVKLT